MPNDNVKKIISLGLTLFSVTAITGVILGVVHDITLEPIRVTQEGLRTEALKGALPEADEFSALEVAGGANPMIKDVQEATAGGGVSGYCITVAPRGYAGPVELIAGITNDGNLRAIRILNQSETPGLGAKSARREFYEQFKDASEIKVVKTKPEAPGEIQAISGATITSNSVASGVNTALAYWKNHLAAGASGEPGEGEALSGASPPANGE
ncbi:MAG: RnfABCDGE type electron transport complex subunit G [Synergistaceae bacterium]|jgi:electron transport complex protein RnfG|nr:RnfABCDGE type electron transport complex subunit G [Synergistaceae bacterium]